jgi:monovalent cation/proton antiporter MnhG/PhaG subunit
METVLDVLGAGVLGLGLLLATVGLYGLLRMPDIFDQLHAAGLVTGPAVLVTLLASATTESADIVTSAALVFVFVLVTAPLAGHFIAQAAWLRPDADGGPSAAVPRVVSLGGGGMRALVAYDGSESARRALELAAELAGRDGSIAVAHVAPPLGEPDFAGSPDVEDPDQERLLAEARTEVARAGAAATTLRRRGDASTELIAAGAELDADLIVVGSRGRGPFTSAFLGSVSSALAGGANAPVVVVGPAVEVGEGPILAGVDGSDASLDAARVAAALDRRLGRGLRVVLAYASHSAPGALAVPEGREELALADEQRAAELLAEIADTLGIPGEATQLLGGDTEPEALAALAREVDAALVVVGSRGRGALRSALLGSFSTRVVADAPCPVVVVPPGARAPAPS